MSDNYDLSGMVRLRFEPKVGEGPEVVHCARSCGVQSCGTSPNSGAPG